MPLRTQEDGLFQLRVAGAGTLRVGACVPPSPLRAGLVQGKSNAGNGVHCW